MITSAELGMRLAIHSEARSFRNMARDAHKDIIDVDKGVQRDHHDFMMTIMVSHTCLQATPPAQCPASGGLASRTATPA